jgi:hypothetical protein
MNTMKEEKVENHSPSINHFNHSSDNWQMTIPNVLTAAAAYTLPPYKAN